MTSRTSRLAQKDAQFFSRSPFGNILALYQDDIAFSDPEWFSSLIQYFQVDLVRASYDVEHCARETGNRSKQVIRKLFQMGPAFTRSSLRKTLPKQANDAFLLSGTQDPPGLGAPKAAI